MMTIIPIKPGVRQTWFFCSILIIRQLSQSNFLSEFSADNKPCLLTPKIVLFARFDVIFAALIVFGGIELISTASKLLPVLGDMV
jgi:hypothetical protein